MKSDNDASIGITSLIPPARALRAALLDRRDHTSPSVFLPENMLRESRRQKGLCAGPVAPICFLDPDGDVVNYVRAQCGAVRCPHWACFHTQMWTWQAAGQCYGVVGSAVGASFAVLVAEQLFVSGCEFLVSIASAGQIAELGAPPYHILIEQALRDEGTSYHYVPAHEPVGVEAGLLAALRDEQLAQESDLHWGVTWTTDAPFRETAEMIARRRAEGVLAVEMEAAALYAFARARAVPVVCIAHVTNRLGRVHGDFDKGDDHGAQQSLALSYRIAQCWRRLGTRPAAATSVSQ